MIDDVSLWRCLLSLGVRKGWRYWRLQRFYARHPHLTFKWAFNCRHEASECSRRGDAAMAWALRNFADELDARRKQMSCPRGDDCC
jgi:hypothetical protein